MGSGAIAAVLQGAIDGLRDQGWSLARPKLQARFLQGRPGLQVLLQAHQADTRRYFAYWIVLDGDHLIQLGLRVPPPAADARSTREAFFSSLLLKR